MLGLPPTAKMPPDQDQYDVSIDLVTMAGIEYTMQTNLTHYEDITQLEDDILCFLPTVSDMDVFGCEVDLIELDTQLPLPEAFHTALLHKRKLQIVVRPCMVEGHSIWQFQADDRESYPKAIRVPVNPRREIADRSSLLCSTYAPTCGNCCRHTACRLCGLAGLSAAADRQAPPLSPKLGRWSFPRLLCPSGGCGPGLRPVQSKGVCGVLLPQQSRCQLFFCTSGGAVCAGYAQVTLVEGIESYVYQPGCDPTEKGGTQTSPPKPTKHPKTTGKGATCRVTRSAMKA